MRPSLIRVDLVACAVLLAGVASGAAAQERPEPVEELVAAPAADTPSSAAAPAPARELPRGLVEPSWLPLRDAALRAGGRRLMISVAERRLWLLDGRDTVFTAPVAVGKGTRLEYGGRAWRFVTPRGVRRVVSRQENPVWSPPDWHYVELARDSGFALVRLHRGRAAPTPDGGRLLVRGDRIVHVRPDGTEEVIPADEEVLFGRTLYMPPMGTANRRIAGELGAYKLDLGGGYMLHGTPHKESIGQAATHGCIRLGDADIEYLYRNVALGTPVYIY